MKKGLLLLTVLIACALVVVGARRASTNPVGANFAALVPTAPALTGHEDAPEIFGRAQDFLKKAKSTSYQAKFIINATQAGKPVALFPAEYRLSYSAKLDKYLYEVTSPTAAVGSALLINRRPTLTARNPSPSGEVQNAALVQDDPAAEVADGCSGSMYDMDGNCYDCGTGELMMSYETGPQKRVSTFMVLARTGVFDLPYLTDFSPGRAEKIKEVTYKNEPASLVRLSRELASSFGFGDITVTVRHRDGAPVAFDFANAAGQTTKHMEASYVGYELTSLTAVDSEQKLELNITLKNMESVKRNVDVPDSLFTRENLAGILRNRGSLAE